MDFTFFNPHSQSEADFLASFVARGEVLDYYVRQLRLFSRNQPARHHLIVAPRGYGKTSLLRRLAIAVRTEGDLSGSFIALTFREEQHNVISLDVFWRNCLQSLLEAREDEHASERELDELDAVWTELAPRQELSRDDQDGHPAWSEFQTRCNRLGRRPLLLMDNLDSLLAGLPEKHQWVLRGILQQEDGPVLIAAAPRFPESTHDPAAAFYDFFRIESLDKLSDREVMRCLRTMATGRIPAGQVVLELLDKDPGRIAALNALAGGNPRTLSVLYSVLESHMSADVLSQLSAMLDTFTSWYQDRSADLPSQARAVFDALALNWDPMTAAAVGTVTGLDITAVSSQISRLEKAALVEAVALNRRGKGRSGYQLSERFFNIWYLMRNGPRRARQSIRFLAVFLKSCFSVAERRTLARTVMTGGSLNCGYALALAASLPVSTLRERLLDYVEHSSFMGASEEYWATIDEMRRDYSRSQKQPDASEQLERELTKLDRSIQRLGRGPRVIETAKAMLKKVVTLDKLGRPEEAVAGCEVVVARFGNTSEPALRESVARALAIQGNMLNRLGRHEQEIELYENAMAWVGKPAEAHSRFVAGVLLNKVVALGRLGRLEQAIEVCESVVARFGDSSERSLREAVAGALFNEGVALRKLGKHEQAIEVYEDLIGRFGRASELSLRERVADALFVNGYLLGQLGHSEHAIEAYDGVVARFGESPELSLRENVAGALVNKARTLQHLGRGEQAIDVYGNVMARYGDATELNLRKHAASALVNAGAALLELGRLEEGLQLCESVVARFGDVSETSFHEEVAGALVNAGAALLELGRLEEGIQLCERVVARFGDASGSSLREQVVSALVNKGVALGLLGNREQEVEVYDSVVARFGDASESSLRERVASALVNKGVAMGRLGKREREIEVYETVVVRFGDASESSLRERVALALVNKGIALGQLGHPEQAIEVFDDVVARFGNASESSLLAQVAWAGINKGVALGELGHPERAIEVYENVVARFGDASEGGLSDLVAEARVRLGTSLALIGSPERAGATLRIAAATATGEQSASAWNALGNLLLDHMGDPVGALAAYGSGLAADQSSKTRAFLHANSAYAVALHGNDRVRARDHVQQALADVESISLGGGHLLSALACLEDSTATRWPRFFEQVGLAVKSEDAELWSTYLDDLQRLIWFVVAQGEGETLCRWMEEAQYPLQYAPLYHAVRAATHGEDHLLQINPETRAAAIRIHEGIARRLKIYGVAGRTGSNSAKKKRTRRA